MRLEDAVPGSRYAVVDAAAAGKVEAAGAFDGNLTEALREGAGG